MKKQPRGNESLQLAAKIVISVTIVLLFLFMMYIAYSLPDFIFLFGTVVFFVVFNAIILAVYEKKTNADNNVGVGFKIFTLLFVNIIAGIIMLCDNDD